MARTLAGRAWRPAPRARAALRRGRGHRRRRRRADLRSSTSRGRSDSTSATRSRAAARRPGATRRWQNTLLAHTSVAHQAPAGDWWAPASRARAAGRRSTGTTSGAAASHAKPLDRLAVLGGRVADVLGEIPARMAVVGPTHVAVAGLLGDHRGGRDRGALGVAADHRPLVEAEIGDREAVRLRQMQPGAATRASASRSACRLVACSPRASIPGAQRETMQTFAASRMITGYSSARPSAVCRLESLSSRSARDCRPDRSAPGRTAPPRRPAAPPGSLAGLVGAGDEPDAKRAVEAQELAARAAGASSRAAATAWA